MNHHAEWLKAELTQLMNQAAAKMEAAETPAAIDLEGCRQRAYKQVFYMIERMERQAASIRATIDEGGKTTQAIEAEAVTIRHTPEGGTVAFFTDAKGNNIAWEALGTGQELTVTTNPIKGRYKLED